MKKLTAFLFATLVATSWSGINNPTGGNGTVTAIGVTTANGISGSSSGGATPVLTLALGAITPTSVIDTDFLNLDAAVTGNKAHLRFRRGETGFGDFSHVLQPYRPASSGNSNDAGRTVTDGITTTGSAVIKSATAWFNLGDINRTISQSGNTNVPAATTISSLVQTTIASGSNGAASSTGTYSVASTTNFPTGGGVFTVLASDGYHNITYTGVSGSTFTGCTGGTAGTLATGNLVYCTTAAIMSANGTTGSGLTITVGGRFDDPYTWGFNSLSDSAYASNDATFTYTIEPSYTTAAGGTRQVEHYITTQSEGGTGGLKRPFNLTLATYNYGTHLPGGDTTMNLYPDTLVIGHNNGNNNIISVSPSSDSATLTNIDVTGNTKIAYSGSAKYPLTYSGNDWLGYSTSGSQTGYLFKGAQAATLFEGNDPSNTTMTIQFGAPDTYRGALRWNSAVGSGRWEYLDPNTSLSTWYPLNQNGSYFGSTDVSGSLGNTSGDYTQLGYIGVVGSYNDLVEVDLVIDTDPGSALRFVIPRTQGNEVGPSVSGWREVLPVSVNDGQNIALDVQPHDGTSSRLYIRLRRKAAGSGSVSFKGKVITYAREVFTVAAATGSSATINGNYPNYGPPVIVGRGRATAQSAANASISTWIVGAADSSFEVSMNMNVTAATALSTSMNCDYTDESNTARTMIFPSTSLSGSFLTGGLVTATGAFETPVMHIRCKAATTITLYTATGTFTSVTYTAEGNIKQTR